MTLSMLWGCFHSINVPSEWGQDDDYDKLKEVNKQVSIQLMSPASGDDIVNATTELTTASTEFPFN